MAAADVVAIPSVTGPAGNVDGLPTTLLEALSSGRAVVATAVGGIPEVLSDRRNGLLIPEKDIDALAGALTELRDLPQARRQLGEEARRLALKELDWDSTVAAFERAYALAGASG
jgi:colanic acid/amylovoran biosynthesis glycosyltransferase